MLRTILAVIAAGFLLAAASAVAAGKTATDVTIDSAFYASGQTHWAGDIFSKKRACKDGRKVLIFRDRNGADQRMGATRSFKGMVDNGYYWTFFVEGAAPAGKYYAKVRATDACKGDRSGTLRLG